MECVKRLVEALAQAKAIGMQPRWACRLPRRVKFGWHLTLCHYDWEEYHNPKLSFCLHKLYEVGNLSKACQGGHGCVAMLPQACM